MPLALDSLGKATNALADLLAVSENDAHMGQWSEVEQDGIRSGVIQNFEVPCELTWKLRVRWILDTGAGVEDGVARRQLFHLAAENHLIHDVDLWIQHHDARNATSHVDDEEKAALVNEATRKFAHDALLLEALEARND